MQHAVFALWVLLFPLSCILEVWLYERLLGRRYPLESLSAFSGLFRLFVWVFVGWLLY